MERRIHRSGLMCCLLCPLIFACLLAPIPAWVYADGPDSGDANSQAMLPSVEDRLQDLEEAHSSLIEENQRLSWQLEELKGNSPARLSEAEAMPSAAVFRWHDVRYANGILISTFDSEQFPFELKFNNQAQLRYAGFARGVESWTDSSGTNLPVSNRSAFELVRGRAIFSGHAFSPQLGYNLSIDYTTVSDSQINFWNYWLSYEFSRSLTVFIGQAAVPGSREWLTPFVYTLGPDYSLATTFFRPSLSQGIWISGEPVEGVHYRAMLSNGFNTLGASQRQLDSRMTLAGSVYGEPLGEFGPGFSDFEWHDNPAIRCGASFTISPNEGQQGSPDLPENVDIRLTDGTLLTQQGALAPGVTVNKYTVALGAIDFGWKYRGLSLSGELYLRELFGLQGDGALSRTSLFDYGGYAQLGFFLIPQKFEVYARTSQINGAFGSGSEYAGGLNGYWLPGRDNLRWTLDAAWVIQSPADQVRTDYRAGDTGLLIRAQVQFYF